MIRFDMQGSFQLTEDMWAPIAQRLKDREEVTCIVTEGKHPHTKFLTLGFLAIPTFHLEVVPDGSTSDDGGKAVHAGDADRTPAAC